jgi:hypothetical protein
MKTLIPNQFLFRFAIPCRKAAGWKPGEQLSPKHRIECMGHLDNQMEFGELRIAWADGLIVEWMAPDKKQPIYGEADRPNACDGLTIWIDTRDARTIHRATRHCHQFFLLAHGGDEKATPAVVQTPIHRATENAPMADVSKIRLSRKPLDKDGKPTADGKGAVKSYWMQAHFPTETLNGFDPDVNSRLGFAARLRDREHGDQLWAAGPEFPYWEDPSLWSVLELGK